MPSSNAAAPRHQGSPSSRCGSGCAGSSKPPTRGGRTTASFVATPTDAPTTATPPSASPPSCSSSASSSPGAIAGARHDAYPLKSLGGLNRCVGFLVRDVEVTAALAALRVRVGTEFEGDPRTPERLDTPVETAPPRMAEHRLTEGGP